MRCIQCGSEFEGQRSTVKFCSDKCRKQYNRGTVSVTENDSVTPKEEVSVTKEEVVTDKKVKTLKDFGYSLKDLGRRTVTNIEFSKLANERFDYCLRLMSKKSGEYSTETDKLHNFKKSAELLHCRPEQALIGMWIKHVVSIIDMVNDNKIPDYDIMQEKLSDAINYLVLLEALFRER